LELAGGQLGAVGHTDLAGVDRAADAHSPAVVDRDPGGTGAGRGQGVEQRPVGDRVGAVEHGLGRAARGGDAAGGEVGDAAPEPWWIATQVGPELVGVRAWSSGQSAIASEPSSMDAVSRYGEATEPESRWSRPMAIGAFTIPARTRSLKIIPARWRSP